MSFEYQQIGLNIDGKSRVSAYYVINQILRKLRDYSDNGPIDMDNPHMGKLGVMMSTHERTQEIHSMLEILANNKIILFVSSSTNQRGIPNEDLIRYSFFVTNRYKLELLRAELMWLSKPEDKRDPIPSVDSLIYYDINSGEIFINGLHKTLKKRNKKLLDVLFTAAPEYVPRNKLLTIARSENRYANEPAKTVVTEAFTNLRKVCGVDKKVINLNSNKGGRLNALTYPLSAQSIPPDFLTGQNPE